MILGVLYSRSRIPSASNLPEQLLYWTSKGTLAISHRKLELLVGSLMD